MRFWTLLLVVASTVLLCCWGQEDPARCGDELDEDIDHGTGDTACHLSSQSLYSYVVRIWNEEYGNTSAHGAIVSHKSVISNCAPFVKISEVTKTTVVLPFNQIVVIAQKMKDDHDPSWSDDESNTCYQTRKIASIFPHVKCKPDVDANVYFNLAMVYLEKPFLAMRQFSYPTLPIPNTLYTAVYFIFLVNIQRTPGCELPLFYYHAHKVPTFAKNMRVHSLRWRGECIAKLCELEPFQYVANRFRFPGQWPSRNQGADEKWQLEQRNLTVKNCLERLKNLMNFTELCVYFPHDQEIKLGHEYMDIKSLLWTGGAPLVCNGTGLGVITDAKKRFYMADFRQDFYQVTTLVRSWFWFVARRATFGQNFLFRNNIDIDMANAAPRQPMGRSPGAPDSRDLPEDNPVDYRDYTNLSTRNTPVKFILPTILAIVFSRERFLALYQPFV